MPLSLRADFAGLAGLPGLSGAGGRRVRDRAQDVAEQDLVDVVVGREMEVVERVSPAGWITAVSRAIASRKMIPVFWDTGNDISRHPPYAAGPEMVGMLRSLAAPAPTVTAHAPEQAAPPSAAK